MKKSRRTTVAAALALAAVIVPCGAWYVAGAASLSGREARLLAAPTRVGGEEARRLAGHVARRLDALRESESRRPYYDYQLDPIDTGPGCVVEPAVRSPLAEGPADPLIWAHFQIDDVGQLTMPTIGGDSGDDADDRLSVLEELECASSYHLAALRNRESDTEQRLVSGAGGVVTVGPLSWHTAAVGGQAAMVALREVGTPRAVYTQGFVVLGETLHGLIADGPFPVTVRPGPPAGATEARIPLEGDPWTVVVDIGAEIDRARREAGAARDRFRATFLGGALAAMLAAGAVVAMVAQSDRLAHQRASFAAAAAHELRTPLAGVRLYAEMLAERSGDPERRAVYAARVADEASRLGRVVTNVLGYAHLERGNLGVHPRPGDLADAVRESVERLRPALEAAGADVTVSVPGEGLEARFDADALHQILHNLLDNAERYGRGSADRAIRVAARRTERGVEVTVRDGGPGIPAARRRRLFVPFAEAAGGDGGSGGLGLGLALVRALVRAQNGDVRLEDGEGGGTRVTVTFPSAGS